MTQKMKIKCNNDAKITGLKTQSSIWMCIEQTVKYEKMVLFGRKAETHAYTRTT